MATAEEYYAVRDVIQYILVPIFFVIGCLGNAVSILVLTRKRMRCSTNIYLTGLAVADIVYLAMVLIMSAQHYKPTSHTVIFWRCRGLFQWLIDGSSYISLWIVVCFTIERYIAVCHPMKGQVFCTEDRAKKVLTIVVFIILLSILSENFEYELIEREEYLNSTTGEKCSLPPPPPSSSLPVVPGSLKNQTEFLSMLNHNNNNNSTFKEALKISITTPINIPDDQYYYDSSTKLASMTALASPEFENLSAENQEKSSNLTKTLVNIKNTTTTTLKGKGAALTSVVVKNSTGCHYVRFFKTKPSTLAMNSTYRTVFDIFTIIFYSFLPLILIIIFNTLLIMAVHKSNRLRNKMTNMSMRQIKQQQQENKITIILIAVVILFTVCQTPWAIFLFLDNYYPDFIDDYSKRICGNIFNTLVAIDAASNFILYCVLSDKYRKTLKELLMGHKYKRQDTLISRQGTLASSWYNYTYKSFKKQHPDESNGNNNRNQEEKKSIKSQKPTPIQKSSSISSSYPQTSSGMISAAAANAAAVTENGPTIGGISSSFRHKLSNDGRRLALRPTVSFHNHPMPSATPHKFDVGGGDTNTTDAGTISSTSSNHHHHHQQQFHDNGIRNRLRQDSIVSACENVPNNNNNNHIHNHNMNMTTFLKSSDSSGSLTRSQSLILQPKTKHSPDCPNFDSNF